MIVSINYKVILYYTIFYLYILAYFVLIINVNYYPKGLL